MRRMPSKSLVSLKDDSEIFLVGISQAMINFGEMPSNHFVELTSSG